MIELLAALTVGLGLALVVVGFLSRARDRDEELLQLLDADEGPVDEDEVHRVSQRLGLLRPAAAAAGVLLERVDRDRSVATRLEKAALPMRPGEFAALAAAVAIVVGAWLWAATGLGALALVGPLLAPIVSSLWLDRRVTKRRRQLEEQLPDLLSSLAASVRGGHSLLRATALLADEAAEPTRGELERVLAETQLGVPVVDAYARLAARAELEDLDWVVEAIRIQQTVGGQLADLLFTLADHLREREEIRREITVLTAEGRLSTWVLSGLPVGLGIFIALRSPDYIAPMFSGPGLFLLVAAGIGIALGATLISRMVRRVAA